MIKKSNWLFAIFLIVFSPSYVLADGDGYFCYGYGYIAYAFEGGYNGHGYDMNLYIVKFGTKAGIEKPIFTKMRETTGGPQGLRCENNFVRINNGGNQIDTYDISKSGKIIFVSRENQVQGQSSAIETDKMILGNSAEKQFIALDSPDINHEYELSISGRDEFEINEIKLDQYDFNVNLLKSLIIFKGNMTVNSHNFEIQDFKLKKDMETNKPIVNCNIKFQSVSNILNDYQKNDFQTLINNAYLIESFIKCSKDDHNFPILLYSLGHYKNRITDTKNIGKNINEFIEYIKDHNSDYYYFEPGADIEYKGTDWQLIEDKYPNSYYSDIASYEITKLFPYCDCEGDVGCYIECHFKKVKEFLKKYPNSKYAGEAVTRANNALINSLKYSLKDNWDLLLATDYYDPNTVKNTVIEYEDIAKHLPLNLKALAYETIAGIWERLHNCKHARMLYDFIIKNVPQYENIYLIQKKFNELPIDEVKCGESMPSPITYSVDITAAILPEPITSEILNNPKVITAPVQAPTATVPPPSVPLAKKGINTYLILGAGLVILILAFAAVMVKRRRS